MMSEPGSTADVARLEREHELFLRLLRVGVQHEVEPFLRDALALIVEVAGADHGYLELHDDAASDGRWWIAHGFSESQIAKVRELISKGIIAQALATGRTINTPSALLDKRFSERDSIRIGKIEAVLCVPIGQDPPLGVLYLQRRTPVQFSADDAATVELVAHHLAPLADRLLARRRDRAEKDPTRSSRAALRVDGVIGRSEALAGLLRQVALVAPLEVGVLITGDTGTGKSQLARVIHDNGPRAGRPFVEVSCGALPETLIENELFGSHAGAHSAAMRDQKGKVAAAEHGTLFLDEIGTIPLGAQAKLLQLLQSKEYYPLGASRPVHADVRVVAASNVDLGLAVRERRFREDLFYRLQVVTLRVPSLAERREDIPELAAHFVASACERHRLPRVTLSAGAVRALQAAEWPGNVRELQHKVEAAAIWAAGAGARQIEPAHLFPSGGDQPPAALTFQEATRRFQARFLREALEASGWNVVETAKRLDLARSHVYNLIRAFGLERERK
jgi:Nif-specific regulatory protein